VSPGNADGTAMPSRWQIDVLVYEEDNLYPVLLLQPGHLDDHRELARLLAPAGLATPTRWEWERGLWPLAMGCRVEVSAGANAVTVYAGGHSLSVGFQATQPPAVWIRAACRQKQVLFVLVPPEPHNGDDELIVDDVGRLSLAVSRHGCLAASIPFA
jgi:hypothetical protein